MLSNVPFHVIQGMQSRNRYLFSSCVHQKYRAVTSDCAKNFVKKTKDRRGMFSKKYVCVCVIFVTGFFFRKPNITAYYPSFWNWVKVSLSFFFCSSLVSILAAFSQFYEYFVFLIHFLSRSHLVSCFFRLFVFLSASCCEEMLSFESNL